MCIYSNYFQYKKTILTAYCLASPKSHILIKFDGKISQKVNIQLNQIKNISQVNNSVKMDILFAKRKSIYWF